MKKAKIAMVGLGHYIYFQQFEGLRKELMQKNEDFKNYLDLSVCDVFDLGYHGKSGCGIELIEVR